MFEGLNNLERFYHTDLREMFVKKEESTEAYKVGLIKGRHEIPDIENYIWDEDIVDPTDTDCIARHAREVIASIDELEIDLYVTGLTVCLGAVVRACIEMGKELVLYHYDRETGEYFPQKVL